MTNTTSTAATKTEITGRTARTATGVCNDGKRRQFAIGDRVTMHCVYEASDGFGEVSAQCSGTIETLAIGTESGMHGTTALAVVRWHADASPMRYLGNGRSEAVKTSTLAVRHLLPVRV
jgi:hypothetical protein